MRIIRTKTGAEVIVAPGSGVVFLDPGLSHKDAAWAIGETMPHTPAGEVHRAVEAALGRARPFSRFRLRPRHRRLAVAAAGLIAVLGVAQDVVIPAPSAGMSLFGNAVYKALTVGWTCVTGPRGTSQSCVMDDDKTFVHMSAYREKDRINYVALGYYIGDAPSEMQGSAMSVYADDYAQEKLGDKKPSEGSGIVAPIRGAGLVGAHAVKGEGWTAWSTDLSVLAMARTKMGT